MPDISKVENFMNWNKLMRGSGQNIESKDANPDKVKSGVLCREQASPSSSGAGAAIYSKAMLLIYDPYVLGISNTFAWRCRTEKLLDLYNQNISANHLDIGVGTGYYLDKCRFPLSAPMVTLGDLNLNCLQKVHHRIRRYQPAAIVMDVLDPRTYPAMRFHSIGINYLLHCLPCSFEKKLEVIGFLKPLLRRGGILFGSTILGDQAPHNFFGRILMRTYNSKQIFSNRDDTVDGLRAALLQTFGNCEIEVCGCVALFTARVAPTVNPGNSDQRGDFNA